MNWVSKAQYLERRIKKLEATLKLLTDHMQVDEDGNIVIEANKFDISANNDIKIKSFGDVNINAERAVNITGDEFYLTAKSDGYITADGYLSVTNNENSIGSANGILSFTAVGNILLKTDTSIELQPTDRLTSTKALEVVE